MGERATTKVAELRQGGGRVQSNRGVGKRASVAKGCGQ